jgi:hypothetical protein
LGGWRSNSRIVRSVLSSTWGLSVMTKSKVKIFKNPFEPRPPILPVGDHGPLTIVPLIGEITTTWETTEIGYAYLFSTTIKPTIPMPAARRAYGSVVSPRARKQMIEAAGEVFFHLFPNELIEEQFANFLNVYDSASSRRNDIAHGVIVAGRKGRSGWYLEANTYSNKRDMKDDSPYAYTSAQMKQIANMFSRLRMDVEAFRNTLKEHFLSCDPKLRARY